MNNHSLCLFVLSSLLLVSCGNASSVTPSSGTSSSQEPSLTPSSSSGEISSSEESSYTIESVPQFEPPVLDDVSVKDLPTKYRTFYQLLVYSFADGNGDGIGDFKGIIDHLDYLEDLGIGGIWLSPIHEADSYHAYDVIDYYSVNHRYVVTVDNKEYGLKELLDACHARGIKVLLDLVLNHSSPNCEWYRTHRDWYSSINAFGGDMKDFNFDNADLRNEIKNVGKYWLNQGVDGFRLDAAKWIYNLGAVDTTADDKKNFLWWNEFYDACKEAKEDVYMIGEVLSNANDCVEYYQSGLDSDFNFGMRDKIYDAVYYARPANYASYVETFQQQIRAYNPKGIECSVISNHDIGRYQNFNEANLNAEKLSLAGLMNILAPGDSYVYYGDELGMDGRCKGTSKSYYNDLNFRTPMPFTNGRTNPNSYLYSYVPSKEMTSTTYNNESVENSTFRKLYQKAIHAKNRASVLYDGEVKKLDNGGETQVASYSSKKDGKAATVIFNCGSSWKRGKVSNATAILGEASIVGVSNFNNGNIVLAPYSAMVLEGEATIEEISKIHTEEETSSSATGPEIDPFGGEVFSESDGNLLLHCKNVNAWTSMNCYAWVGNIKYLGDWPGSKMSLDGEWFTVNIPHGASNVIFNDGRNQTVNLHRPSEGEYWFVMEKGTGNAISGNWYRQNPEK